MNPGELMDEAERLANTHELRCPFCSSICERSSQSDWPVIKCDFCCIKIELQLIDAWEEMS